MNRFSKIISILILIGLLVSIRAFESDLFYDPLILFFKTDHTTGTLPAFDTFKLLMNISLRYLANTILSLAILWLLFKERGIIKLSFMIFVIFFVVFMLVYGYLLFNSSTADYILLFYVRRFLIQPLLLLILIPAFYFHKLK
jgi:exosortase F-associated protein